MIPTKKKTYSSSKDMPPTGWLKKVTFFTMGGKGLADSKLAETKQPVTSWWLNHPFEKYATVKLEQFPRDRGEHKNRKQRCK